MAAAGRGQPTLCLRCFSLGCCGVLKVWPVLGAALQPGALLYHALSSAGRARLTVRAGCSASYRCSWAARGRDGSRDRQSGRIKGWSLCPCLVLVESQHSLQLTSCNRAHSIRERKSLCVVMFLLCRKTPGR